MKPEVAMIIPSMIALKEFLSKWARGNDNSIAMIPETIIGLREKLKVTTLRGGKSVGRLLPRGQLLTERIVSLGIEEGLTKANGEDSFALIAEPLGEIRAARKPVCKGVGNARFIFDAEIKLLEL